MKRREEIPMGVDTKAILIGQPSAVEIALVITEVYGFDPEIRVGLDRKEVPTYFILSFPEPEDQKNGRQLHVFTETSDDSAVFDGPATHCTLGMWGSSIEIMEALARKFGGFVCDSDSVGDWRPVDRIELAPGEQPPLTPEATLNLRLAKVIDAKAALEIRKLVKNREQFAQLMDALADYRAQTADVA
jgi:hypothetical protein